MNSAIEHLKDRRMNLEKVVLADLRADLDEANRRATDLLASISRVEKKIADIDQALDVLSAPQPGQDND